MTASLKLQKFRDEQVAEDFNKMVQLGWLETEFTMYGCAYWDSEKDTMCYKISPNMEELYIFIENASIFNCYPSNIMKKTKIYAVPIGMKEVVALEVKKETARELQKVYSKELFELITQIGNECYTDVAADYLWEKAEMLEGIFDLDEIETFESFVRYMYSCKKILPTTFKQLVDWILEERKNMCDEIKRKDIFEKKIYGVAYQKENIIQYTINAQLETIYTLIYDLEQNGYFVTPIYSKTYYYNYTYRLKDVMTDFKREIKDIYNETVINQIKTLTKNKENINQNYEKILSFVREKYGELPAETFSRYAGRWSIV